ncbi:MAG: glycosyltransferase family 2 protein [Planctomycetes bacterium]|nr:glycosyltransferase family 2 protein [Planctomycetota bacterium]
MTQQPSRLTVVAPAYDEEEVLPHFHRELCRVLEALGDEYDWEVLYVDDGSSDGTLGLLRCWAALDARVRYVSFSRNFGHQAAFTAGLENARGDIVVLLDCDLQHPPALIPALVARWKEGFDVVRGVRARGASHADEGRASRWFAKLFRMLSDTPVREGVSDFCLLSRRAVNALLRLRETHRFLRGLVQWLGFPSAEVPFRKAPRPAGVSKFSMFRLTNYALDALLSFSRVPLRLPLFAGLAFLLFGLGTAVFAILAPPLGRPVDACWAVLLVSVQLIGGSLLCGLGAIGEYVGRIYEQVKGRPLYLVKETEEAARLAILPQAAEGPSRSPPAAA